MRRLFAAAAIAALTLATAACGSDDEESSATTERDAEASEDTESDDDAVETSAADDDSGDEEPSDDEANDDEADDDADVPSGDLSRETCVALAARISEQMTGETAFGDFAEAFDEVKSVTPDEIDDDLDVLSEAYGKLADLIEESGGDLATAMQDPDVLAEMQALDSPAIQEANENVSAFFAEACPDVEFES